ncbi:hypothetical protein ACFL35_03725 [Candidatus Riflebacteria bacterium]
MVSGLVGLIIQAAIFYFAINVIDEKNRRNTFPAALGWSLLISVWNKVVPLLLVLGPQILLIWITWPIYSIVTFLITLGILMGYYRLSGLGCFGVLVVSTLLHIIISIIPF